MDTTLDHYVPGEDTGTLVITLGPDDDIQLTTHNGRVQVQLPLYAYQARELIEVIGPLASEPDAA